MGKSRHPREPDRWKPHPLPDYTVNDAEPGPGARSSPYQKGACFFARREFTLSEAEAGQSGVLRWELIRWGFTATLNGVKVGGSDVYGPGYLAIPPTLLRAGTNEFVLKVRTRSSPFQWRVDRGSWQTAEAGREIQGYTKVMAAGTTFAWCYLGTIDLTKGGHHLEIQVTEAKADGHFLLSQDCFLLVPTAPAARVLACSSGGLPVLAWLDCGPGQLLVTQLLLAERLSPASPAYDPVAEQFFANLLAF